MTVPPTESKKPAVNKEQLATLISIILVIAVSVIGAFTRNILLTAIFVGALGGVFHEVAQSNGKVVVPKPDPQSGDIYLGGLFGLMAGGVARLLVAQGLSEGTLITNALLSEAFLAGLGLKGFSEAVAAKRPV